MKYEDFSPSPLEKQLAEAIGSLCNELEGKLDGLRVISKETLSKPQHHVELVLTLEDKDQDQHIITMRMIHTPAEDLVAQGFM